MNFFATFPGCSLPSIVSKNTIKMIGHHSRLRDMIGQSQLICACTRANHARYSSVDVTFCGSSRQVESAEHIEQYYIKFVERSHYLSPRGRKAFVESLFLRSKFASQSNVHSFTYIFFSFR